MSDPLNDYDHKMQQPWQVLGQIRDDLRQARAHLRNFKNWNLPSKLACECIERALARVGDGSQENGNV